MTENKNIEDLKSLSDNEVMFWSNSRTDKKYPMEMIRRLKDSVDSLNRNVLALNGHVLALDDNVSTLNKTTTKYSKILIWLTIAIGILTAIQVLALIMK